MWSSMQTPWTLPRNLVIGSVAISSVASAGYYYYYTHHRTHDALPSNRLRRMNALRHPNRRSRHSDSTFANGETAEAPAAEAEVPVVQESDRSDDEMNGNGEQEDVYDANGRAGHNIVGLLFRVSEDNARRNSWVHRGCQCNSCNTVPIRGIRYRCSNCADFDLCESCEAQGLHNKAHVFYKIRVPVPPSGPRTIQPVLYTGDPENCNKNLPKSIINRLCRDTGFDRATLEALWERWTFLANTEWREDPDDLCIAIDRKTFDRCIVHTGNGAHFPPNLVHDRMFAFFDQNNDGLISFREYLVGLNHRSQKDRLKAVFQGYDIDGDGYVDRKDFLRMFRAYFAIFKHIHREILEGIDTQVLSMTEAQHIINGRTPISGFFGREENSTIFERPDNTLPGKTRLLDGSYDLMPDVHGFLDQSNPEIISRAEVLQAVFSTSALRESTRTSHALHSMLPTALLDSPNNLRQILELVTQLNGDPNGQPPENEPTWEELTGEASKYADDNGKLPEPVRELSRRVRHKINERWKKRMFYLDVEEGTPMPGGVNEDDDIVDAIQSMVYPEADNDDFEIPTHRPMSTRSRSSSKVRFVDDGDDLETRSNASTSSRSIPERWGGFDIPEAERDCGKEVLYITAQEAFNELLDIFFKEKEDLALKAAETREVRHQYKNILEMLPPKSEMLPMTFSHHVVDKNNPNAEPVVTQDDLFHVIGIQPLQRTVTVRFNDEEPEDTTDSTNSLNVEYSMANSSSSTDSDAGEYRDPTMPQFKPATADEEVYIEIPKTITPCKKVGASKPLGDITEATLRKWKKYTEAEVEAVERRGFGKLSFEEFERIYRANEKHKNRIDYLETWIDICMI